MTSAPTVSLRGRLTKLIPPNLTNSIDSSKCYLDLQPLWTTHMIKHQLSVIKPDNGLLWIYASHEKVAIILHIPLLVGMHN